MKIIFLDLDGVMVPMWGAGHTNAMSKNNKWAAEPMCKKAVKILNEILDVTNAEIVISSDWRHHYKLSELREIFDANGVKKLPIAFTVSSRNYTGMNLEGGRMEEIREYVKRHRIEHWVSIDDLDMFDLYPHFAHCKNAQAGIKATGLKDKIIKILDITDNHLGGYMVNMDSKEG
jgi:hypothetical protein